MLCWLVDRTFTLVSSPSDSSSMMCHRSLLSALLVFHLGFVDSTDSFVINKTSPAYFSHTLAYFAWFGRCRLGNHLTGNQKTIRWIQAFQLNERDNPNSLRRHIDFCEHEKQRGTIDCTHSAAHSLVTWFHLCRVSSALSIAQLFITLRFLYFCTQFYSDRISWPKYVLPQLHK